MKTNQVMLIGYVGGDPKIRKHEKGSRARIRVATHYPYKLISGTIEWRTVWHDVVAWGRTAEYAERSFVKGSKIMIQGAITYRTYPDKTGHIRYVTEITAHSLMNLDR